VRIDKVGKTSAPSAPAAARPAAPAGPSSGPGSFSSTAEDAAQALEIEQQVTGRIHNSKDAKKAALESIDDIAARNSLNIVERKSGSGSDGNRNTDQQA
jgi:hypothetical protein